MEVNDKALQIWRKILEETCNCYADPISGNRPCDNGILCDDCAADWVNEIYYKRLEEAGITLEEK